MKKLILLILLITTSVFSQNYDLNTGVSISQDKVMNPGYFIGGNFIIKTNQNRKYLNNLILGFENSGFQSNNINYSSTTPNSPNMDELKESCNCISNEFDNINSGDINYNIKYRVRGTSINLGVELSNNWYFMSGVTNYKHMTLINGNEVSSYRNMFIDVGLKYFIKNKHWYFIPTIKYNPEVFSFGIGISYQ